MAVNEENLRKSIRYNLNRDLLLRQGLSDKKINYLIDLYVQKFYVYKEMRVTFDDNVKLRELAGQVTEIEYLLQATWGFKQDKKYHKFWELPGCQCPVFDNIQKYGKGEYIYSSSCPIHGKKSK